MSPRPDTVRKRRQRRRQRLGLRIFALELDEHDAAEALINAEMLAPDQALDHGQVAAALSAVLADISLSGSTSNWSE